MIRKGIRSTNKPTVKNETMNQELENVNQNWIHLNTLQIENTMQVGVTTIAFEELLINHEDPEVGRKWQLSSANEFGRAIQGVGNTRLKKTR